ncbi:hypothetical protein ANCCAN_27496 [Ancylostoma caninum]|uniref:Uncharacterized protein n=1 Tax=Ancylostoma caninum TaxID=29170 RepID=A0A368F9B9_ANCCA|nr:hypothetical protein ANCCAN_27496 [Ancylostoma caninum]
MIHKSSEQLTNYAKKSRTYLGRKLLPTLSKKYKNQTLREWSISSLSALYSFSLQMSSNASTAP